jgi:outer membrane protein OmpA-like peptidoglycan-associated protein/tetratricopeptide (TPR) repeat protein
VPFKIKHIIYLFIFFYVDSRAQEEKAACQEIDNKEAVKAYQQGIDRKKNNKEARVKFLKVALELEPDYADANFAYAKEILVTQKLNGGPFKPSQPYFLKVVQACPKYHSDPYYYLGAIYFEDEKYDSAAIFLKKYIDFADDDEKKYSKDYETQASQCKEMLKYAKFYKEVFSHPVPFDPVSVQGLCSQKDEYLPIISPDNELAFFTRKLPVNVRDQIAASDREVEAFCFSKRKDGVFVDGRPMADPFNKNSNEGGATVTIDNKRLYYTIAKDEGGVTNYDIYYSDFAYGQWTAIKNLGPNVNDPKEWDSQPSIASDGRTLYFASMRQGGFGGIDIYKTVRDATTGEWGTPVNLGPTINTSGNEKSPFIHSDSETLYFTSDGHPGIGGYDIFFTKKDTAGKWMEPKNIGYPINTQGDEVGFFVSTDGKLGYFSSNNTSHTKGKTMGGWDIYSFELYKEARPEKVAFVKGELKDDEGKPLQGASAELKNIKTKETTDAVVDSVTGEYAAIVNIKNKDDYVLTIKKEGYAFNSQIITAKDSFTDKPVKVNFEIKQIAVGQTYILNNIYYQTNSAELKPESKAVIEEFAEFLKANPDIKIEIHGHTDNVGTVPDNSALSTDRAFTVYDLLVQKGIPKSRVLAFKGFGASKPLAENSTEAGRAKNRRTEFIIVEN